jgi:hypothetical protein
LLLSLAAVAGGSATIDCGDGFTGSAGNTKQPTIRLSYTTGSDAGTPGLFWLGLLSPDQTLGAVLTEAGWTQYNGGLYPFQARYDGGLPAVISRTLNFPNNETTTSMYQGYTLYVGHGVYTAQAREKVAVRRNVLDTAKPELVARGRWRPENDTDLHYVHALIQKDMVDNKKYGGTIQIPVLNCNPSQR